MGQITGYIAPYAFNAMIAVPLLISLWILYAAGFFHVECLHQRKLTRIFGGVILAELLGILLLISDFELSQINRGTILVLIVMCAFTFGIVSIALRFNQYPRREATSIRVAWVATAVVFFCISGILAYIKYQLPQILQ